MTTSTTAQTNASTLELSYSKLCPGMEQAREINVSSLTSMLSITDEAGEASLKKLTNERISKLADTLRKAKIEELASAPGKGSPENGCTTVLTVSLNGKTIEVKESPSSTVTPSEAWKAVQQLIADLPNE